VNIKTVIILVSAISLFLASCGGEAGMTAADAANAGSSANSANAAGMQVIGTAEAGYVMVPDDWLEFQDASGNVSLQYANPAGTSIITLNVFDLSGLTEEQRLSFTVEDAANNVWYNLEQNGVTDIKGATVSMAGYDAHEVYGYFMSEDHDLPSAIVCWIFADRTGILHYVSAEAAVEDLMAVSAYIEENYTLE